MVALACCFTGGVWLHPSRRTGHLRFPIEAESGSLALRLACSPPIPPAPSLDPRSFGYVLNRQFTGSGFSIFSNKYKILRRDDSKPRPHPTTHVGSLPRNETLSSLLVRREEGEAVDPRELAQEMDRAVRHVVEKQAEAGIDIGNDGEQQRVGFQTYVPQRMSGFAGESKRRRGRDYEEFPELIEVLQAPFPHRSRMQNGREAQGELHYLDASHPARNRAAATLRDGAGRFPGMLHDRAFAGHHLDHHAQRAITTPRRRIWRRWRARCATNIWRSTRLG